MSILDKKEISIPCSNCGRKTRKSIGWIKRNKKFTCMCRTTINLDSADFVKQIRSAEKSIEDIFK